MRYYTPCRLYKVNGAWVVRWTDLHSFSEGYHWTDTPLHPSQDVSTLFPNKSESELEGLEVEFDFAIDFDDIGAYANPWRFALIKTAQSEMEEVYKELKRDSELPKALFSYSYKDFEGCIHPFNTIMVDLKDEYDLANVIRMLEVKKKYGEFFMFFNGSTEGKKFWSNNPITINTK